MVMAVETKPVILWVDDDADDAELFRHVFERLQTNHLLVQVCDGMEALTYLQQQEEKTKPALIVLDINMPMMNGMDLLASLKRSPTYRGIPVVMVSTSNSEEDRAFCEQFHVMIFEKPNSPKGIETMVQQLVSVAF